MAYNQKNARLSDQSLSFFSRETFQNITTNLQTTLTIGIIVGVTGIVGYSINLQQGGWKILFICFLLAAAAYISGFFLGFLFGIPKRNIDRESTYNLSTNLVDISDWLTKIIIGLGLVEIKRIPGYLSDIGTYIQQQVAGENSLKVFSICCIIYFTIFGLYYGYNYMRLFLSGQFKEADDHLLQTQKELNEKGKELDRKITVPTFVKDGEAATNLDDSAKKKLDEYNNLVKTFKTEESYTFEDWYYKGVNAYEKQDYTKVIVYMKNALEKDPNGKNAPDAYLYLGLAYYNLKLFTEAIEATNRVIDYYKHYPHLALAHCNNGIYYSKIQMYQKALEEYEKAMHIDGRYSEAYAGKGYVLIQLATEHLAQPDNAKLDEALLALEQAIKLNPTDGNSWYNKAYIFALKKKKEEMLDNLKKAIEINAEFKTRARDGMPDFKDDEEFKRLVA